MWRSLSKARLFAFNGSVKNQSNAGMGRYIWCSKINLRICWLQLSGEMLYSHKKVGDFVFRLWCCWMEILKSARMEDHCLCKAQKLPWMRLCKEKQELMIWFQWTVLCCQKLPGSEGMAPNNKSRTTRMFLNIRIYSFGISDDSVFRHQHYWRVCITCMKIMNQHSTTSFLLLSRRITSIIQRHYVIVKRLEYFVQLQSMAAYPWTRVTMQVQNDGETFRQWLFMLIIIVRFVCKGMG